jgi:dihydrofolate synthase/folylpolyglutamate synthase
MTVAEFHTLADWLTYLEQLHPKTIELGLGRIAEVRSRLGLAPAFPLITVGGTNGKGSTCAMLESMLHAAGYRVGCYTSPHLLQYNERVRVDKQAVSDAELCAAFARIEAARRVPPEVSLTYFEFGTLAAMLCFTAHAVEAAILEVGLGGRLDAVNAFDADCAVVCSVDLDHMEYLGDTREKIAFEKAGIFRRGRVAVFGDADMPQAIAAQAEAAGAPLWRLGQQFRHAAHGQQWDYHGPFGARSGLPYPALRGAYQLNNASAALAALDALRERLPVSMDAVRRGLVEVTLAGRFQVLPGRPVTILDVAHNPHAARALARNLDSMPPARTYAVCAMLRDKDMAGVARALDGRVDVWLAAGIDAPRGATGAELAQALRDANVRGEVRVFGTAADALRQARNAASEDDRIVAFGSFYTVAEVMRALDAQRTAARQARQ